MREGDEAGARQLLQKAVQTHPTSALLWLNVPTSSPHHRTRTRTTAHASSHTLVYTVLCFLSALSGLRWREAATNRRRRRRPSAGARPSDAESYCRRHPSSWREPTTLTDKHWGGEGACTSAILSTARARVLTSRVCGRPVEVEANCLLVINGTLKCGVCGVCGMVG
jgi:hypothetical protein